VQQQGNFVIFARGVVLPSDQLPCKYNTIYSIYMVTVRIRRTVARRARSVSPLLDTMARRNRGKVLATDPDRLGDYVVSDYVQTRKSR
jgi:hypothetical protein